ncbi:uncharacterized protein G2W53_003311 [Senna tora]|uniref:Uncharacterized protein n=1 Tax=Senna tora TaxID=362788 RepID=A0A834X8P9_9FABA|nr:uncharacterized protein G2W53_003311 [Senna tora]
MGKVRSPTIHIQPNTGVVISPIHIPIPTGLIHHPNKS